MQPRSTQRASDVWNEVADECLDLADVAARSGDHFATEAAAADERAKAAPTAEAKQRERQAQRTADREAHGHRMVEAASRMQARRFRERARLLRAYEDAQALEDAARGDDTTGEYLIRFVPKGSWWKRWRFW